MDTGKIEALVSRMDRLESQNRILKHIVGALGIALVALAFTGSHFGRHAKQLEAEAFMLRDASGKARASLAFQEGEPALVMLDNKGREQIALRSNFDRSSTLDLSSRGRVRLSLNSSSVGASALQMFDEKHSLVSALYAWPQGVSGLALNHGRAGMQMGVQPDGTARLAFSDSTGHLRGGWEMRSNEQPRTLTASRVPSTEDRKPMPVASPLQSASACPSETIAPSRSETRHRSGGGSFIGSNATLAP